MSECQVCYTPVKFAKDAEIRARWTARLVRMFSDANLDIRPADGSPSTREQVQQICASNHFTASVLTDEVPDHKAFEKQYDVTTVKAALASLRETLNEVILAGNNVAPDFWAGEIAPFGPEWKASRAEIAYLMLEHETHHRGQLTVYLRIAGKVPPMLYGPAGDEVWEPEQQ